MIATESSTKTVIAARFGGEMYVAVRPIVTRVARHSRSMVERCILTGCTVSCACDCGASFAVDLPSGEDWTIKQLVRSTTDKPLPSFEDEPHFTYIRTQLAAPPCEHWNPVER